MTQEDTSAQEAIVAKCRLCGQREELFELPEEPGEYCLACSADVATAILLTAEIDAATLAGRASNALIVEFSELTASMLRRCQRTDRAEHFRPF
jgi:hypothetical protein